ncbi:hypothetical protein [Nevskia sp.]|uniref:hypothetical protein n=1 Tax=Nevskia sp. TaxID=1929292 RepID=UPI003F72531B
MPMIIVRPLDDELAEAHAFRHQHIEGYESQSQQIRSLRRQFGIEKGLGCKYPTTNLLAVVGDKPVEEYVRRHTMLPLMAAVPAYLSRPTASINDWLCSSFHLGLHRPIEDVRICVECIRFDDLQGTVSSYRRRHHIRGTSRCPWHGCRLHAVRDRLPLNARPNEWVSRQKVDLVTDIEADVPDTRWMHRYTSISMAMLSADKPVSSAEANKALLIALEGAGFSTSIRRPKPLVSDLLSAKAGTRWIAENLPVRGEAVNGTFATRFDGFGDNPWTARSSILHAAVWACFDQGDPWTKSMRANQSAGHGRVPEEPTRIAPSESIA